MPTVTSARRPPLSTAQIDAAVARYFTAHPQAAAAGPTDAQVASAANEWLASHIDQIKGDTGPAGSNVTDQQVANAVISYLDAHPNNFKGPQGVKGDTGAAGRDGVDGAQGPAGAKGDQGVRGDTGLKGDPGTKGDQGLKGNTGDPGPTGAAGSPANTLVGTVILAQTAVVAIALGTRELPVALPAAVAGERYVAIVRRYKLNGAATWSPGRPQDYVVLDTTCRVSGTVLVSLTAPLLAIGANYSLETDILRLNA